MKFLPICAIVVICLVVQGYCETIQCYECEECNKLDDSLLISCPPEPTTTTTSSSSTTTSPSSTATSWSTTNWSSSTWSSTTSSSSTESETTESSSSSSAAPEEELMEVNEGLLETLETTMNPKLLSIISRNSRQVNYESLMLRHSTRDTVSYQCYCIERDDGGERKTKKGCVEVPDNTSACEVLKNQYGVSDKDCRTCSENRCNGSVVLTYSLLTVVVVVINLLYFTVFF